MLASLQMHGWMSSHGAHSDLSAILLFIHMQTYIKYLFFFFGF